MKTQHDLAALAANYHKALPGRIRQYLNNRGITDLLIDYHAIGWNGNRITIPIHNREGEIAFFKLARDPEDEASPKMMASPGAYAELYEWGVVLPQPGRIIICEGEFDRMVLTFVDRLGTDPAYAERIAGLKRDLLARPELTSLAVASRFLAR